MTDLEKGYVAGIIDGEGSIVLRTETKSRWRYPAITVGSSDRAILDKLKDITQTGCIYACSTVKSRRHKEFFSYQLSGAFQTCRILKEILPLLQERVKARRAYFITLFWEDVAGKGGPLSQKKVWLREVFEKVFYRL